MITRTAPRTNGTRQPQSSIADELSNEVRVADIAEPSSEPPAVLTCWKLPKKPRRAGGDHSMMKAVEVPHSPARRDPLRDPQCDEQYRSPDTYRFVGWKK